MFIVSCATYDPNTNELNSYVLGKSRTLAKAKMGLPFNMKSMSFERI